MTAAPSDRKSTVLAADGMVTPSNPLSTVNRHPGVNVMNVVNVFPPLSVWILSVVGGRNLVHHVHGLHHATADRRHQRPASPDTLAAMAVAVLGSTRGEVSSSAAAPSAPRTT